MLKLKDLKHRLKSWNRNFEDSLKAMLEGCSKRIKELDLLEEERSLTRMESEERNLVRKEYLLLAIKEEMLWRQYSKVKWLKEGDKNIKFSHKMASSHKSSNSILGLSIDGVWSQDQRQIRLEVEVYYTKLYSEEHFIGRYGI